MLIIFTNVVLARINGKTRCSMWNRDKDFTKNNKM